MKYYEVTDPLFAQYGRIITGIDTEPICDVLRTLPLNDDMTYVASEPQLEALEAYHFFQDHVFAGMPIQMGYVTGKNARLDCLEHHMCSEIIMDTEDVIILLAQRSDVEYVDDEQSSFGVKMRLDTSNVVAFAVPAGCVVELYNSTLHFAPCGTGESHEYRGLVVLSRGTNTERPTIQPQSVEDETIWAKDNWLLAHPQSAAASQGAYIGLVGDNIDIAAQ